jgi:hypothetical protein
MMSKALNTASLPSAVDTTVMFTPVETSLTAPPRRCARAGPPDQSLQKPFGSFSLACFPAPIETSLAARAGPPDQQRYERCRSPPLIRREELGAGKN